ncbi:porin [Azohydromonas aeria]|uniref:porin n=1 Tax=Azohydromonas aeria TaxID=2590212 RepID=UPI0012FC4F52|nr:porin [Azohydromonas aeria]
MKRIPIRTVLLALGAAALMPATALAQSSVNIGGMVDVGIYRDGNETWNVGTIQRSYLTFSGTEDLGSGLAAFFNLTTRFDMDTGTLEGNPASGKPFFHGESTVGLKGAFGSVKAGRALDAMWANDWHFDPWYNFNRVASPAWDLWHYNFPSDPQANSGRAEYGRLNNGIFYDSPVVGGFSLHVSGSPEKRPGDSQRPLGGAIKYAAGPITAMVAREKNSAGASDTFVGLKGKIDSLALMGAWDLSKSPGAASKAKAITLGAQYFIGPWTLNAGWGQVDVDGVKAQKTTAAGAVYALSKRTSVYADVARKSYPGDRVNLYGLGVAHTF